jgi:hypothetical protein
MSGIALFYEANMFNLMILYYFCMFPAQYNTEVESRLQIAHPCAFLKISNVARNLILHTLLMAAGPCYVYSLDMDRTENTVSNISSIVLYVSVTTVTWRVPSHCLPTGVFAKPFHSNGCLCGLSADSSKYLARSSTGTVFVRVNGRPSTADQVADI